jgi:hypothetical protein
VNCQNCLTEPVFATLVIVVFTMARTHESSMPIDLCVTCGARALEALIGAMPNCSKFESRPGDWQQRTPTGAPS